MVVVVVVPPPLLPLLPPLPLAAGTAKTFLR
jgi:hypothetical protein